MYGPVQFRVTYFIESNGVFRVTCPEIADVLGIGATEREAVDRAREAAIAHLRPVIAAGGPIPDGPLHRTGSNSTLEHELTELLEAAHPGEGRRVCVEELWIDPVG
jgi:predicted RNase H-like HicB family nuclease